MIGSFLSFTKLTLPLNSFKAVNLSIGILDHFKFRKASRQQYHLLQKGALGMSKKLGYFGNFPFPPTDAAYIMEKGYQFKWIPPSIRFSHFQWVLLLMAIVLLGGITLRTSTTSIHNSPIEFTIVTAASRNHFCPLQGFLYSLKDSLQLLPLNMKPRVLVYDIGLDEEQRIAVGSMANEGMIDEFVSFNYSNYPSFWDIRVNKGEYAWKIGIIREVTEKYPGAVLWMDSGNRVFTRFLVDVVEHIQLYGFYSPLSPGNVRQWMHPGMPQYFDDDIEKYADKQNCNGAFVGVDPSNQYVMTSIVGPWFDCAMDKRCIAPDGSSRVNHRQDQAALTYLTLIGPYRCSDKGFTGLLMHQDHDCERLVESYLERKQKWNERGR